ncbi:hypothetical protein KPH14_008176 [Odynerus spinipes]|uniref:folate gamma-glutamyl hydrolase n=1 Tax=Odynerus spinipes TaxID=1348599 RepID=A0AAD9RGE6_9HYME|nr:hypothetical protein KPH14_008176 [Odynerus spinipes]
MSTVGKIQILFAILLSLIFATKCFITTRNDIDYDTQYVSSNDRPIIGILTEEINYRLNQIYPEQYKSYIAASYVKFVEGAGGRVVPIWIGKNNKYYRDILGKVNGVLWPGGNTFFNETGGYAQAGYKIYEIAKEKNREGHYFPIFGICLGFELLTYVAANKVEHRIDCSSNKQALSLLFKKGYNQSRLFKNASLDIIQMLKTENVTINFHKYCVTEKGLANVGLSNDFRVLSRNWDTTGVLFVSSLEHVSFPFYGLQFHPEKNIYEWVKNKNIPHTADAVRVSQYFANFFINEARKNKNRFLNRDEELRSLIYNYPPVYTGAQGSAYEQCYLFP